MWLRFKGIQSFHRFFENSPRFTSVQKSGYDLGIVEVAFNFKTYFSASPFHLYLIIMEVAVVILIALLFMILVL